jgi:glycosyltransferase involved in cell wall biosynthesis
MGSAVTRNKLLDIASGDWVAMLDADDLYLPGAIDVLLELAIEFERDIVASNILFCDADTLIPYRVMYSSIEEHAVKHISFKEFVTIRVRDPKKYDFPLGILKPLYRRSLIEGHSIRFDESLLRLQDGLFFLRCLDRAEMISISPCPFYVYMTSPKLQSSEKRNHIASFMPAVLKQARPILEKRGLGPLIEAREKNLHQFFQLLQVSENVFDRSAIKYLHPSFIRYASQYVALKIVEKVFWKFQCWKNQAHLKRFGKQVSVLSGNSVADSQ